MKESSLSQIAPPIDYKKSIEKKALVYKITFKVVFDHFLMFLASFMLIGIATLIIPVLIYEVNDPLKLAVFITVCLAVDIWMGANLVLFNRLICIKGLDSTSNKENVISLLDEIYDNIYLGKSDKNIIRAIQPPTDFTWGRIITVLLNGNEIYINFTTLGRGISLSPFNGFSNHVKCKRIAKAFIDEFPSIA